MNINPKEPISSNGRDTSESNPGSSRNNQKITSPEEKKEPAVSSFEKLVDSLIAVQNSAPKLTGEESIASHHKERAPIEKWNFLGMKRIFYENDNTFLTEDEKFYLTFRDANSWNDYPPNYPLLTCIMERVELVTTDKINSLYRKQLEKIIDLAKTAEKEINEQKAIFDARLPEKNLIREEKVGEVTLGRSRSFSW